MYIEKCIKLHNEMYRNVYFSDLMFWKNNNNKINLNFLLKQLIYFNGITKNKKYQKKNGAKVYLFIIYF